MKLVKLFKPIFIGLLLVSLLSGCSISFNDENVENGITIIKNDEENSEDTNDSDQ